MEFRKKYEKLIDLVILFIVITSITLAIKYYFKPFIAMIIIFCVSKPLYKFIIKFNIPAGIAGALSIFFVNTVLIIIIIYLGNSIYWLIDKLYYENINSIEELLLYAGQFLEGNINFVEKALAILDKDLIKSGASATGEGIMSYFIGNVCAYFMLVDRDKIVGLLKKILPKDIINKVTYQRGNLREIVIIQVVLIIISTIEMIIGFIILKVERPIFLGVICGILDILPYVGTIIVFIPIIIYNIIVKDYLIAFGLIVLYILVQVIREILEAKFLSSKLQIHPLLIFLSIYIGIKLFGILGLMVGPLYGILANEIIYHEG
ncbi:AI-2E family transporter [Clostridium vincentii]|uniref:Pheromone autoinducer 2 transporter n=1 Tax=Clostridium vincentii TaxID=52704 RepID=A0A2T0BJX6_9CLOT|nr:AI-2E family transporter [Clostridium vincentii]PRR84196.1 pheromone autoinducer 2 transporter [Clostridium vincentii]